MNPMQGIMFRDHGLNHIGNNIVHENKMPYYDHEIKLTQSCLIHFGLCNKRYMRSKGRYYMLLEYLEDPCNRTVSYLNLRYSRGVKPVKIFDNYTYPYFIDDKIFDVDLYIEKYDNKLINLVMNNKDKLDKLYRLDIWDNKILYNYRKEHIKFYDLSNLHYINRNYHWIKMIFSIERLLCLLNNRDFDLVYNHLLKVMRIRK